MKVAELSGARLDYWAAESAGADAAIWGGVCIVESGGRVVNYSPSREWADGGPLIEEYDITVTPVAPLIYHAVEGLTKYRWHAVGTTYLEAAMRCLVRSCYGNEVSGEA